METEKKSNGALVGLTIIIIILVMGGIYIWRDRIKQMELTRIQNATLTNEDANSINSLEQSIKNVDTKIGVDAKTVK